MPENWAPCPGKTYACIIKGQKVNLVNGVKIGLQKYIFSTDPVSERQRPIPKSQRPNSTENFVSLPPNTHSQ